MAVITETTDAPEEYDTPYRIVAGDIFNGVIEGAGDGDAIALTVEAGMGYRITISSTDPLRQPYFQLRDEDTGFIAWSEFYDENGSEAMVLVAPETGTLFIGAEMAWSRVGSYTVTVDLLDDFREWTLEEISEFLRVTHWAERDLPTDPRWFSTAVGPRTITYNIEGLEPGAQQLAEWALDAWQAVANVTFVRSTSSAAHVIFDDEARGAWTDLEYQGDTAIITGAFVNIDRDYERWDPGLGDFAYKTFLHEIGHVLGLGHGGFYNFSGDYSQDAVYPNDSQATTVMSYFGAEDVVFADTFRSYAITPMPADILAVRTLYGTKLVNVGDTVFATEFTPGNNSQGADGVWNRLLSGEEPGDYGWANVRYTIVDSGGTDVIDASGATDRVRIDLNDGATSRVSNLPDGLTIMQGTIIERAKGSAFDDTLIGNAIANELLGGSGDDSLYGNDRRDVLHGGEGADWLEGNRHSDTIYGQDGDDRLDGGLDNDRMNGGTGNDTLYGGGGYDTLWGWDGDDTIFGDDGRDVAYMGAGDDLFLDNAQGGERGRDTVYGGDGNDTIEGGAGDDTIQLGGGNDMVTGGDGADVFVLAAEIGADRITDYDLGIDSLHIAASLWGGPLTQAALDARSDLSSGTLVLDFGGGDRLTLDGLTTNAGLLGDIVLV
ncbi:M10 family metallopeptidase C-terminal domain-containing protein [Thetidibacter halocola]|uniref:Peptidase metallopeptidase domain-containing protein n=1 Tax=Thetidibacter halocola TaxID=2827239 RepID=A0A8J8B7L0_9RHOB|nr:M10 family metallopeptidase C-terminal domain-containing protein [Thetidibacter halocola]MBS0123814.1 hypothetical protein [Thetidibacter halocola]